MRRFIRLICLCLLVWAAGHSFILAQHRARRPVNRVRLPKWDEHTAGGIFYEDAFADGLTGDRPPDLGRVAAIPVPGTGQPPTEQPTTGESGAGVYAWSQVISPDVIEDEVKRIKLQVDQNVTSPGKFAGRGYKDARRHFSMLATLFAIITEYDGEVRWKAVAPLARDLFARTAANAKVGTIQVFNEAKNRKVQLQELISGGSVEGPPAEAQVDWSRVCDRAPLMQRLEAAHQQKLMPGTASKAEFTNATQDLLHEAEIVAAIAEVLTREGMEDGDDEDYARYSHRMRDAARQIVEAARLNNDEKARQAVGDLGKACSECHEGYRA